MSMLEEFPVALQLLNVRFEVGSGYTVCLPLDKIAIFDTRLFFWQFTGVALSKGSKKYALV